MPRPDLKSLPITEWFKPRGVSEQLELPLDALEDKPSFGKYKAHRSRITNELVSSRKIIKPYYGEKNDVREMSPAEKWRTTIGIINSLEEDQVLIIPYDAELFYQNKQELLKKGNLLKVRFHEDKPLDLRQAVGKKLGEETLDSYITGIDFQGTRETNKPYKVFTLVDCIKASILDDELPQDSIEIKAYLPKYDVLFTDGALVTVKGIPSLSRRKAYSFNLKHVAVRPRYLQTDKIAKASYNLISTHDVCEFSQFMDFKYGRNDRKGDEECFDVHVILGVHRAQKVIQKQYPEFEVINPFPKPSGKWQTEDFFWKLLHNVIVESYENDAMLRAPLGNVKTDLEVALHKKVAYNNEQN